MVTPPFYCSTIAKCKTIINQFTKTVKGYCTTASKSRFDITSIYCDVMLKWRSRDTIDPSTMLDVVGVITRIGWLQHDLAVCVSSDPDGVGRSTLTGLPGSTPVFTIFPRQGS